MFICPVTHRDFLKGKKLKQKIMMSALCSTCDSSGFGRINTCRGGSDLTRQTGGGALVVRGGVQTQSLRNPITVEAMMMRIVSFKGFSRRTRTPSAYSYTTGETEQKQEEEVKKLNKGISELYDESSGIWEDIWGDHMHHGFYQSNASVSLTDHRSAQIRMIEETLRFASVPEDTVKKPKSIVDVGCGIGGSSRYLARKYDAQCQGITLSPVQVQRAQALASAQGLADKVYFQVADALNQPFQDGQFDLVWSMESGEHMPDKTKFVSELVRVAAPGATIIIVTWCHRDLSSSEESLRAEEKDLLNRICDAYYLPAWCSTADYVNILQSLSLQDIKTADWSEYVAPFWPAVIRSALTWKGFTSLLRSGWKTIKGALVMPLMIEGYKKDLIKFAIITCRKPE